MDDWKLEPARDLGLSSLDRYRCPDRGGPGVPGTRDIASQRGRSHLDSVRDHYRPPAARGRGDARPPPADPAAAARVPALVGRAQRKQKLNQLNHLVSFDVRFSLGH